MASFYWDTMYIASFVCLQANSTDRTGQQQAVECQSDHVHAQLLAGRVTLKDGVWIVDDNVRCHGKFMVKLTVSILSVQSICATSVAVLYNHAVSFFNLCYCT